MASLRDRQRARAARVFARLGTAATYRFANGTADLPLKARVREPSKSDPLKFSNGNFGDISVSQTMIDVLTDDVAQPRQDDMITLEGGRTFIIKQDCKDQDKFRILWHLDVKPSQ